MIYAIILWLVLGAYWVQSGRFLGKGGPSPMDMIIVSPVLLLFTAIAGVCFAVAMIYKAIFK